MNGSARAENGINEEPQTSKILQALEITYNPQSASKIRQEATRYLEEVRSDSKAPFHGFELASSRQQQPIVRHYGLSLIDYAIRFRWANYLAEESKTLRGWVWQLAQGTGEGDPPFITNKIAEMWVELSKRSWVSDWMDMDEALVQMWAGPTPQKEMVLTILATLSEEIFDIEDSVVAARHTELTRACIDIFTPAAVLSQHFPNRDASVNVRYGSEGWTGRMAEALESIIRDGKIIDGFHGLTSKLLSVFKSIISWIIPDALVSTDSLSPIFLCLKINDVSIQLVCKSPQAVACER